MTPEEEAFEEALRRTLETEKTGAIELNLGGLHYLVELPVELKRLKSLQTLHLSGCWRLFDLRPLAALSALRELNLAFCGTELWDPAWQGRGFFDLSPIAGLTALQTLNLSGCDELGDLCPLARLRGLQVLRASYCFRWGGDLSFIAGLTALQTLDLSECGRLYGDLSSLVGLTALQSLNLFNCEQLSGDLNSLAGLVALQTLILSRCELRGDLSPIAGLTALQSLDLSRCEHLRGGLNSLACLGALQTLNLSGCKQLSGDLGPLAGLTALQSLDLSNCEQLREFASTKKLLPSLQRLYVYGCKFDDLPREVCGESAHENVLDKVRAHYEDLRFGQRMDAEAKVLFLGNGGVSQYDFAHVAMPNEPPRLFLSYGVRDASQIAERLRCDLAARGYEVWQDVSRLRAGRPWDEDVPEGLRTSQVMLALLSPQSVRRAMDAGNPTASDSVCLDEIAYARGARKIPIVPIQVISCEAPFLIYRLHQIDFRHWRESEATYQAGLNQICAAIAKAIQSRKSPERPWTPSLEPWDFAPFLLEKRNHFTGRKWLFRELDDWRRKEAPHALLITGEPGIGKSAIVAALVTENSEGQVLAYHCCRADTSATLEPARFVRSLAGMLAARLEGYAAMLENSGIKGALERADTDPGSAFEAAILSPLHSVPKTGGGRRYLLIDALDEALMHPKRPTIVEVLATRINRLPSWLGIVATTRSEPGVLSQLRGLPAQALKADDPKNQDDVLAFLQRRLSEPGLRNKVETSGKTLKDVALGVLRSSAGNFLFVTTAIDAVEGDQLRFDDIENQPPGRLSSLYEMFFNRLFRDAGVEFQAAGQVLEVVAAAREPLTRKQIAAVSGLDAERELPSLLGRLAAFVPVRNGRYSLFHRSLFEWLIGWDTQQDQPFAGPYHVSLQEGYKRLADWGWAEYCNGIQSASLYCLRHLVAHLHEGDRNDQARTVLLDFDWLQTKLFATDPNALISDYDYLPENKDMLLVQASIRLSTNALACDARQLAGQLIGRLLSNTSPSIQALLKQADGGKAWPWLRPLKPSLTAPGGSLIRTLEGHMDSVSAVAVTPDGLRAVSGSNDRTLRVWDLKSGQTLRTLEGHTGWVNAVAVTPDGRRAVSGSEDGTLRVWDLESGQTLRTLEGHTYSITAVALTSDGRRAVSASRDGTHPEPDSAEADGQKAGSITAG